jgi:hypothetical protein
MHLTAPAQSQYVEIRRAVFLRLPRMLEHRRVDHRFCETVNKN